MKKLFLLALLITSSTIICAQVKLDKYLIKPANESLKDAINQFKAKQATAQEDLQQALFNEDMHELIQAIMHGADLKDPIEDMFDTYPTALHYAAAKNKTNAINVLIRYSVLVDIKDRFGNTPLHIAAKNGRIAAIKALIKNGAYVNATQAQGDTPLHYASNTDYPQIAAVLIESGADINARNRWGETPLHTAASDNNAITVSELIRNGAEVNALTNHNSSPLDLAQSGSQVYSILLVLGTLPGSRLKSS